jgi:hypothetical protein
MKISPIQTVSSSTSITNPWGVTLGSPALEAVAMGYNFVALNASLTSFVKLTIVCSPLNDHVIHSHIHERYKKCTSYIILNYFDGKSNGEAAHSIKEAAENSFYVL